MGIISDAFLSAFTSRKKDGGSLQNYTRQLNRSIDILESHLGGPLIFREVHENHGRIQHNKSKKNKNDVKKAS